MKTIKTAFIILLANAGMAAAQVPDSISQRFRTTNPNVNDVQWQTLDNSYKATYHDQQNIEHVITYNRGGALTTPTPAGGKSSEPVPQDSRGIQPTSGSKSLKGTNNSVPNTVQPQSSTRHRNTDMALVQNNKKSKAATKATAKKQQADTDKKKMAGTADSKPAKAKRGIPGAVNTTAPQQPVTSPSNPHDINTIPPRF